jgi:chlorophyll synthase
MMVLPQLGVILLLLEWQRPLHALAVLLLILGQIKLMQRFVAAPAERALQLSAFGVPLLVTGMMVAAFALRGLGG